MAEESEGKKEEYYKRPGTTDKGKSYEDLLTAILTFKLANDGKVKNFQLSSNNSKFDKFDDIVVEIEYKNGRIADHAVQMKHKQSEEKIVTRDMLAAVKGKFSLQTYFESFKAIKNEIRLRQNVSYVLYTNARFEVSNDVPYSFKLKNKEHIKITPHTHKLSKENDLLNTSDNDCVYKFDIDASNETGNSEISDEIKNEIDEYKEFFSQFFFYPNQKMFGKMKPFASELFKKAYSCDENSFKLYTDFISDWSQSEGNKVSLNKEIIKFKIGEVLLRPYMKALSFSSTNETFQYFREACLQCDITIAESGAEDKIVEVFNGPINEDIEEMSKIANMFCIKSHEIQSIEEVEDEEATIILWHMNKIPLIIPLVESKKNTICQAIGLCQQEHEEKRKFVLVGDVDRKEFVSAKVFQNLNYLASDSTVYQNIVQNFKISLQDREAVTLEAIIGNDDEMRETITVTEIMKIMEGSFRIGEEKEELPKPYIDQFLTSILIDFEFINEDNNESLSVISCKGKLEKIKSRIFGAKLITIHTSLNETDYKKSESSEKIIFLADDECTMEEFNKISEENPTKICHHFQLSSNEELEWITSNNSSEVLREYLITSEYIQESKIIDCISNKINIIFAEPGMGKTVMLKYLKNRYPSSHWIALINLREHFSYFQENHEAQEILEYILEFQTTSNKYDSFETRIRRNFRNKNKLVFLWDGLDELPSFCQQPIMETMKKISNLGFTQWVTARNYLKAALENKFKMFSQTIKELDKRQQVLYIKNQLKSKHNEEELEEIIEKITKTVVLTRDVGVLGIPLQTHILTELFLQNAEKYKDLLARTFTLADMIDYFVKEKFNFWYKEKGNQDLTNYFMKGTLKGNMNYRTAQYEIIALKTFFPKEIFASLHINSEKIFAELDDNFGIVTRVDNDSHTAVYVHNIYGEYFVATWMTKNLSHVRRFKSFIFEEPYTNIRMIFDMILAKDCPAHLAVIYKDFDNLRKYKKEVCRKDKAGRSPLHLACSWGERRPLLNTEIKDNKYVVDHIQARSAKEDSSEYKRNLKFLMEIKKCDPLEKDELFNWNSIGYADSSFSLLPLEIICQNNDLDIESLTNFKDFPTVLYYCVKFNYTQLFAKFKTVHYIENKTDGNNLLYMAVSHCRNHFLSKIFENKKYLEVIDKENRDKLHLMRIEHPNCSLPPPIPIEIPRTIGTPELKIKSHSHVTNVYLTIHQTALHVASVNGNEHAVKLLIEKKADVNIQNNRGYNALHLAVQNKHLEIVKMLIRAEIDINQTNENGENGLHIAARACDFHLVQYLLEQGLDICMNKLNVNPLDIAILENRFDIFELLLKERMCFIKTTNYVHNSFMHAVNNSKTKMVNCLIKKGVDVNEINANVQQTALHLAAWNGDLAIAKILTKNKANINVCNSLGETPLHSAASKGHVKMVELLIKNGADIDKTNNLGVTSLCYSILIGHNQVSEFLINYKSNINMQDNKGNNVLSVAVHRGNTKMVKMLIEHGANVNTKNKSGYTSLHVASLCSNLRMLELLVNQDGDVNVTDNYQRTPLSCATFHGYFEIVKFLIARGADINKSDENGDDPLLIARRQGHGEIFELLSKTAEEEKNGKTKIAND